MLQVQVSADALARAMAAGQKAAAESPDGKAVKRVHSSEAQVKKLQNAGMSRTEIAALVSAEERACVVGSNDADGWWKAGTQRRVGAHRCGARMLDSSGSTRTLTLRVVCPAWCRSFAGKAGLQSLPGQVQHGQGGRGAQQSHRPLAVPRLGEGRGGESRRRCLRGPRHVCRRGVRADEHQVPAQRHQGVCSSWSRVGLLAVWSAVPHMIIPDTFSLLSAMLLARRPSLRRP